MNDASQEKPQTDYELLKQLRDRSLGDDAAIFDLVKTLSGNPILRFVGRVLRVDLATLDRTIRESDELLDTMAASINLFAGRGWAPSDSMPVPVYEAAVAVMAGGGTIDEAEAVLVDGWNGESLLRFLPHRVRALGLGNEDEIESWYQDRARLVERAWQHHVAGAYEAAIPIVFAQIDGITADATLPPKGKGGKMFFSPSGGNFVDVVDDTTLAGMHIALPVARRHFLADCHVTGSTGSASRHGVVHGRELAYDTRENSTKAFVLLAAVVEWAGPRIRAEIDRRRAERDQRFAGSNETDSQRRRLDRRGFEPTRAALQSLAFAEGAFWRTHGRFASMEELMADVSARYLLEEPETVTVAESDPVSWWAWRKSESGWVFAIGCPGGGEPLDLRYYDGPTVPDDGLMSPGWFPGDEGNWSDDWQ